MRASISSGARDRASGPGTCRTAQCVFFASPWTRTGKGAAIAPKLFGACRSRPVGKIIDPGKPPAPPQGKCGHSFV